MRPTDKGLVHVIKRFPGYWGQICRLADTDKRFKDLCRDYAEALEMYRHWRERGEPQALERARDYATAVSELEAEISRELTGGDRLPTQR